MSQRPLFDGVEPKALEPTPDPSGEQCRKCGRVLMRTIDGTWCPRCEPGKTPPQLEKR